MVNGTTENAWSDVASNEEAWALLDNTEHGPDGRFVSGGGAGGESTDDSRREQALAGGKVSYSKAEIQSAKRGEHHIAFGPEDLGHKKIKVTVESVTGGRATVRTESGGVTKLNHIATLKLINGHYRKGGTTNAEQYYVNRTDNVDGQPRHPKHQTWQGLTSKAAQKGYENTGEPDTEAAPILDEDEEMGQGDRDATDKRQQVENHYTLTTNEFASDDQRKAFFGILHTGGGGDKGKEAATSTDKAYDATTSAERRSALATKAGGESRKMKEHGKAAEAHSEAAKAHFQAHKESKDKLVKSLHSAAQSEHNRIAREHEAKTKPTANEQGAVFNLEGNMLTINSWSDAAREASAAARKASAGASSKEGHSKASNAHMEARRLHEKAAANASGKSEQNYHETQADRHEDAAESHHVKSRFGSQARNQLLSEGDTMTKEQRQAALTVLTANCSCQDDADVLHNLSDETLLKLTGRQRIRMTRNAKAEGSNADATAPGEKEAGGEEDDPKAKEPKGTCDVHTSGKGFTGNTDEDYDDTSDEVKPPPMRSGAGRGETVSLPARNLRINPMTDKEWLEQAPAGIRSVVINAMAVEKQEKNRLIGRLVANVANKELRARLIANHQQKAIAALRDEVAALPVINTRPIVPAAPEPSYLGASGGPDSDFVENREGGDESEVLDILTMNQLDAEEAPHRKVAR